MIEKEVERQIAFLHAAYGLIAGIISGIYYRGDAMPLLTVLIGGAIIAYPAMLLSKKMFNLNTEDFDIKAWLGKGFLYFLSIWLVSWVFVYNLG